MLETWTTRDLPLLVAIVAEFEENPSAVVMAQRLQTRLGMDPDEFTRAICALDRARPPFFDGVTTVDELPYPVAITSVSERALQAVGQWPTPQSLIDELIANLNRAADEEPDPETKSKLQQAAHILGGAALQIAIGWATASLPHP